MVKVIRFEDDAIDKDRFRFLYDGFCMSAKAKQPREYDVMKREAALRRKLEAISQPESEKPAADDDRFKHVSRNVVAPADLEVDQSELQMLRDYVIANAWSIMAVDTVIDAVEWAWGAPERKSGLSAVK